MRLMEIYERYDERTEQVDVDLVQSYHWSLHDSSLDRWSNIWTWRGHLKTTRQDALLFAQMSWKPVVNQHTLGVVTFAKKKWKGCPLASSKGFLFRAIIHGQLLSLRFFANEFGDYIADRLKKEITYAHTLLWRTGINTRFGSGVTQVWWGHHLHWDTEQKQGNGLLRPHPAFPIKTLVLT